METFHSSTSNSKAFIRDIAVLVFIIATIEVYLIQTMGVFEKKPDSGGTVSISQSANYYVLGQHNPVNFFRELSADLTTQPIIFIGDSQGAGAFGGGSSYPKQISEQLQASGNGVPVVSLHIGGANAYEQTVLLFTMLKEGITPCCIIWSNSIFSMRKNEIRTEFTEAYYYVENEMEVLASNVIVSPIAEESETSRDPVRRVFVSLSTNADQIFSHLAIVRFMQRSLWDKAQILRRSPLGQLIPSDVLAGTSRQYDPPKSILEEAGSLIGNVAGELESRGIRVIVFLAPINRGVSIRPFTDRAELAAYPALQQAVTLRGIAFLDLVDALHTDNYGSFSDGTPDAFHIDAGGHTILADTLLSIIYSFEEIGL